MQNYYLKHDIFLGSKDNLLMQLTIVGALFQVLLSAGIFIGNLIYSTMGHKIAIIIGISLSSSGLIISSFVTTVSIL